MKKAPMTRVEMVQAYAGDATVVAIARQIALRLSYAWVGAGAADFDILHAVMEQIGRTEPVFAQVLCLADAEVRRVLPILVGLGLLQPVPRGARGKRPLLASTDPPVPAEDIAAATTAEIRAAGRSEAMVNAYVRESAALALLGLEGARAKGALERAVARGLLVSSMLLGQDRILFHALGAA